MRLNHLKTVNSSPANIHQYKKLKRQLHGCNSNNIWWSVLTMQVHNFILPRFTSSTLSQKIFLQHPVLEYPQPILSP